MTPEERAKDLLASIIGQGTGGWRFADEVEEALPLIAKAIRSAENDKLEEAARMAEQGAWLHAIGDDGVAKRGGWDGFVGTDLAERIRSLISKD